VSILTGGGGALVLSAAVRALPAPPEHPVGFWQNLYLWFSNFTHSILANWDRVQRDGQ
jgi:hypothetical protein